MLKAIARLFAGRPRSGNAVRETFLMESVEQRRLMSVTGWSGTGVTEPTGHCLVADVRVGDNGYTDGVGEMTVGTPTSDGDYAYREWDADPYDGFDSGWVPVQLRATLGAAPTTEWNASQTESAQMDDGCGTLSGITLRAGVVSSELRMSWDDVVIQLYQNGQISQTIIVGDTSVDTFGYTDCLAYESVTQIDLSGYQFDEVVLTGSVRLEANYEDQPGPSDVAGQIYFFA